VPVADAAEEAVPPLLRKVLVPPPPPPPPAAAVAPPPPPADDVSARAWEVVPMRRVAADPRVEERRGGASLGRREPDRPVAPAMLVVKYCYEIGCSRDREVVSE
jgi:hypothetical protein